MTKLLLPVLPHRALCTAKHYVKFYAKYGMAPPSPLQMFRYLKASST